MSSRSGSSLRGGLLLFVAVALFLITAGFAAGRLAAQPAARPTVRATVLQLSCTSIDNVSGTYAKIADVGQFDVQAAESLVELQFNGRLYAGSTDGTGLQFELRVDDAATSLGRIRAVLKVSEIGSGVGRNATMSGFYEGLAAGTHTVSVWARTANGNDSDGVMYDPGCWSSDVVTIKEYLPFGVVSLPAILRN